MFLIYFMAKKRGYPRDERASPGEMAIAFREAIVPLLMPIIMLGGIVSGIFTPTEAAAVAALYALAISVFYYRSVGLRDLPQIFVETMVTTAVVTFIISTTSSFSFILSVEDAGTKIAEGVLSLTSNKFVVLFMINILLLIFGAIMEAGVVLILFIPILYPLVVSLGVDPIHFGIIMCANLMIGVATPPVGMSLFVMSHIARLRMEVLMKAILPFLAPIIGVLLLLTYWEDVVMLLPNLWME